MSISESAFIINYGRDKFKDVSKDVYAHLWLKSKSIQLSEKIEKEFYPHLSLHCALRHRWFLERADTFLEKNKESVFINIGAGFTNYPFLFKNPHKSIEIDLPETINFKKNKIKQLVNKKLLPSRTMLFEEADLNSEKDLNRIKTSLSEIIDQEKTFVLMEGLTYYLHIKKIKFLIENIISQLQAKESLLAFDYWPPDIQSTTLFKRYRDFAFKEFSYPEKNYTFMDPEYIESISGYKLLEAHDLGSIEKVFSNTKVFKRDDALTFQTQFVLLQKK